jgi:hypothetical protein
MTAQWAWRTTLSETLPISARLIPPRPLLPIAISPAPTSSARARVSGWVGAYSDVVLAAVAIVAATYLTVRGLRSTRVRVG